MDRGGGELCESWLALPKSIVDHAELAELYVALDDRSAFEKAEHSTPG